MPEQCGVIYLLRAAEDVWQTGISYRHYNLPRRKARIRHRILNIASASGNADPELKRWTERRCSDGSSVYVLSNSFNIR